MSRLKVWASLHAVGAPWGSQAHPPRSLQPPIAIARCQRAVVVVWTRQASRSINCDAWPPAAAAHSVAAAAARRSRPPAAVTQTGWAAPAGSSNGLRGGCHRQWPRWRPQARCCAQQRQRRRRRQAAAVGQRAMRGGGERQQRPSGPHPRRAHAPDARAGHPRVRRAALASPPLLLFAPGCPCRRCVTAAPCAAAARCLPACAAGPTRAFWGCPWATWCAAR